MACRLSNLPETAGTEARTEEGAVADDSASLHRDATVRAGPTAGPHGEQRARIRGADAVRGTHVASSDPKISEDPRVAPAGRATEERHVGHVRTQTREPGSRRRAQMP